MSSKAKYKDRQGRAQSSKILITTPPTKSLCEFLFSCEFLTQIILQGCLFISRLYYIAYHLQKNYHSDFFDILSSNVHSTKDIGLTIARSQS